MADMTENEKKLNDESANSNQPTEEQLEEVAGGRFAHYIKKDNIFLNGVLTSDKIVPDPWIGSDDEW